MSEISDYVGIFGVLLILICYFLLQTSVLKVKDFFYSFLNLIGAICLLISLLYHWNLASVVIEIAWMMISIYGIINSLRRKN
ncbi:MAG TPA: hypothetical protein VLE96_02100 [Chlamydiales bacterium]|nr:hypothetical protein [Chlamydiales bacterium]